MQTILLEGPYAPAVLSADAILFAVDTENGVSALRNLIAMALFLSLAIVQIGDVIVQALAENNSLAVTFRPFPSVSACFQ